MDLKGTVLLNDHSIGSFTLDEEERVIIDIEGDSIKNMLDFATENGMVVGLQFRPEYGSED